MKALANFANTAISRVEMKNLKGGTCWIRGTNGSGNSNCYANQCADIAQALGTNWCCSSCSSASWCPGC